MMQWILVQGDNILNSFEKYWKFIKPFKNKDYKPTLWLQSIAKETNIVRLGTLINVEMI